MTDNRYSGWTNYETWNCALWIDNDQVSQEFLIEQAREILSDCEFDKDEARADLVDAIESFVDEQRPDVSGMFADLLSAAIGAIEWRELADHYLSDIDVYSAGYNMPGYMPDSTPALFGDASDARTSIASDMRDRADRLDDGIDSECLADDVMSGDRTRIEQMAADLREAADDCENGSGEYGCTVAGYHYFISKI